MNNYTSIPYHIQTFNWTCSLATADKEFSLKITDGSGSQSDLQVSCRSIRVLYMQHPLPFGSGESHEARSLAKWQSAQAYSILVVPGSTRIQLPTGRRDCDADVADDKPDKTRGFSSAKCNEIQHVSRHISISIWPDAIG